MYLLEVPDHKEQVLPKFVMGLDIGQTHPCFLRVCFTTAPFKYYEYILKVSSLLPKKELYRQILPSS